MQSLVLITSVIDTPHTPLSYCPNRSVYSKAERYEQTKKTISTIRNMIPECKIFLVECSNLSDEEKGYFENTCDYVLNLWNNKELHNNIFGLSKALGEGTMTIKALDYIMQNDIEYDNLFKITGRYWLTDNFKYERFDNNKMMFKKINADPNNIYTLFYKIPNTHIPSLYDFLVNNMHYMRACIGYEVLFGMYVQQFDDILYMDNDIGVAGFIAVKENEYFEV